MRILMQARGNLFDAPGGDTTQIIKTAEHLEKLGISCEIVVRRIEDYRAYDIVHLFNVTRIQETYCFARDAKAAKKPVVLSTIYWDNEETERMADVGWRRHLTRGLTLDQIERLKGLWRVVGERQVNAANILVVVKGFTRLQQETLRYVDWYLPNSEAEMALFRRKIASGRDLPYTVVPNGVDVSQSDELSSSYSMLDGCVLCVGRIDGRKNQLNLVRAMSASKLPLVFVGKPAPNHSAYMRQVQQEATPDTHFIGQLPQSQIVSLYRRAKVHCLPSWYETPGLASLEAAAEGCNIVVTNRGSTGEYFGDHAYYCEPDDVDSIRRMVLLAHAAPVDQSLRQLVRSRFTWEEAARKTAEAYMESLGLGNGSAQRGCPL